MLISSRLLTVNLQVSDTANGILQNTNVLAENLSVMPMNDRDLVFLLSNGIPLFEHVIIDFLTSNINRTAR